MSGAGLVSHIFLTLFKIAVEIRVARRLQNSKFLEFFKVNA